MFNRNFYSIFHQEKHNFRELSCVLLPDFPFLPFYFPSGTPSQLLPLPLSFSPWAVLHIPLFFSLPARLPPANIVSNSHSAGTPRPLHSLVVIAAFTQHVPGRLCPSVGQTCQVEVTGTVLFWMHQPAEPLRHPVLRGERAGSALPQCLWAAWQASRGRQPMPSSPGRA